MRSLLFHSFSIGALLGAVIAQTVVKCNSRTTNCPSDPAFPAVTDIDFTTIQSLPAGWRQPDWCSGSVKLGSADGMDMTLTGTGSCNVVSDNFLLFGYVEVTARTAPGKGIVSSLMMVSDNIEELDWEWLGKDPGEVQTNYFPALGDDGTYNRGGNYPVAAPQQQFHTYALNWTTSAVTWLIDGRVVRKTTVGEAHNQLPQTPMNIRIGPWSGGDSKGHWASEWAGGKVDWSKGPFTMSVKRIKVINYSPGQRYEFADHSGSWQGMKVIGGTVGGVEDYAAPQLATPQLPPPQAPSPQVPPPPAGVTPVTVPKPTPSQPVNVPVVAGSPAPDHGGPQPLIPIQGLANQANATTTAPIVSHSATATNTAMPSPAIQKTSGANALSRSGVLLSAVLFGLWLVPV